MKAQNSYKKGDSDEFCSMTFISEILGNTWVLLIINQLLLGAKRFSILQENIQGLNPSTLTDKLKMLEKRKLISRKVFPEIPVRVEYSLTKQGKELSKIIGEMTEFGEKYYKWCKKNEVSIIKK